jgi:hypothetical protein
MTKPERAREVANCQCMSLVGKVADDPTLDWVMVYEFFNTTTAGHLIAASLILDGLDCKDVE